MHQQVFPPLHSTYQQKLQARRIARSQERPHHWGQSLSSSTPAQSELLLEQRQEACRPQPPAQQAALVSQLAQEVRRYETGGRVDSAHRISAGCQALDDCLPHSGYVPGTLVEYLRATPACGASYLAFAAAAAAMQANDGFLVVVDSYDLQKSIYPMALCTHGIDLQKVIFVRTQNLQDSIWAIDQALRTSAVSAVLAELDRFDDRAARRLQLAAETGEGLGLLLRSAATRHLPSWAEVQWLVQAVPEKRSPLRRDPLAAAGHSVSKARTFARQFDVQLVRNRGGRAGTRLRLMVDGRTGKLTNIQSERNRNEQTVSLRLASQLARPENPSRRTAAS